MPMNACGKGIYCLSPLEGVGGWWGGQVPSSLPPPQTIDVITRMSYLFVDLQPSPHRSLLLVTDIYTDRDEAC